MTRKNDHVPAAAHLLAVWAVGSALSALQTQAVVLALFAGNPLFAAGLLAMVALVSVALLALLGAHVRALVPLTARRAGLAAWAASVWCLGTLGAAGAVVVGHTADRQGSGLLAHVAGGACYAVAAAFFVPGARVRPAACAAAAALIAGGAYTAWDATRTPTVDEWISAGEVDRALLRVGDPPPGWTVRALGASEDGFGAEYERPGHPRLHLGVARAGRDTRRADAAGCPVPFGEPIVCTDDGGGRLLIAHGGGFPRSELRLTRDGLVHTVTVEGDRPDLAAARRVLARLRPATDAELTGLLDLPMRR
ncbi:hypothetical protein [Streptomyces genisteinicus]|uniref:Uncharacterized protein n=1 Tax=Streptomyces genisteinicus TaxID=2768068 RepID=A0A7H0I220_9ACTN|nr:hypothetical protein [Streptomyces genisteinicus]QNP66836.1 hypothetical protein IAG43_30550 [Streptomyces genisteinicus]